MQQGARRIAWTSAVIHGLVHASVLMLPTLLGDLTRTFGVSMMSVLGVLNAMYLVFGLAAIPAGYFADRVGSRHMLIISSAGCTLSLILVSLAPSFPLFAAGLLLLGMSAGVYHPSGLSLLSRGVAAGDRGRAIGIHGVGGSFGEAIAPAWAALFAVHLGWRYGFVAAAALAFGSALLALSLPPGARPAHLHPCQTSFPARMKALGGTLAEFWSSRPLRWLLLSTVASGFVYRGVLTFLPLHLAGSAGGMLGGSFFTSAVLIAGIFAQRFGGELADRLPHERLFLAEVALFVPVLLLLGIISGSWLIALALAFGFLWYLAQPLANAMAAAYANTGSHGLLYGIQFASTFGIGSFATSVGGYLHGAGGTHLAFLGFGSIAVVQLVAALALVRGARAPAVAVTPP